MSMFIRFILNPLNYGYWATHTLLCPLNLRHQTANYYYNLFIELQAGIYIPILMLAVCIFIFIIEYLNFLLLANIMSKIATVK